jgi:hypothetical protein
LRGRLSLLRHEHERNNCSKAIAGELLEDVRQAPALSRLFIERLLNFFIGYLTISPGF